ncbi:MAG: hypothetical protein MSS80_08095 [Mollicutes bacterium]|nr:hypothetical protein [Mollicutes bacterium]
MDIDYIELMQSDFSSYRINGENILELDYSVKPVSVDVSLTGNEENQNILLINSLLLVVDDYTKIFSLDDEEDYNPLRKDLAQIVLYYKNGNISSYFTNLSKENMNDNQTNALDDNKLFITIEENL